MITNHESCHAIADAPYCLDVTPDKIGTSQWELSMPKVNDSGRWFPGRPWWSESGSLLNLPRDRPGIPMDILIFSDIPANTIYRWTGQEVCGFP